MSRSSFIPIAVFLVLLVVYNDNFVNCKKSTTTVTSTTTRSQEKIQVDPSVNHALVHFMDLKRAEFLEKLADVKEAVADALNDYCKENDCGLNSNSNFTSEHIGFYGASEKEKYVVDGRFIIGKIYAEIKDGISKRSADEEQEQENEEDLKRVLSKDIMEDFFTKSRDEIVNESEVQIAYVNNKLVYPARNNLDNYLIVSISCGFCVALIIFNLICQRKLEKQAKEEYTKKNSIYNPDAAEKSTQSKSGSLSSLKNRNNFTRETDEKETELEPLNDREEESQRYIEPVQRFPMPNETPMLATNQRYMPRTNPNMRLTQV